MNFRTGDGTNMKTEQNLTELEELARQLIKNELTKMGLEKELLVTARKVLQLSVREAINMALGEMAGSDAGNITYITNITSSYQSDIAATVPCSQAPATTQSPAAILKAVDALPTGRATEKQKPQEQQAEPAATEPAGIYVYGVAEEKPGIELEELTGIAGCRVYTLSAAGLYAIVHDCPAEPYRPDNDEQAKEWLFEHQDVLDQAKEKLGTVLPFGFNTIICAAGRSPQDVLKEWLVKECRQLKLQFERLRDHEEYAVKVLASEEVLKKAALQEDNYLQELQRELEGKPEGARYLYQEKLEQRVREALEDVTETHFRRVYKTLRPLCSDIRVEKTKRVSPGTHMIANLSCLVEKNRLPDLGAALAKIHNQDGFSVDFTGPWPPYSFVGQLAVPAN